MLSLLSKFDSGQRESVHYANEIIAWSDMENCDANCQKACCTFNSFQFFVIIYLNCLFFRSFAKFPFILCPQFLFKLVPLLLSNFPISLWNFLIFKNFLNFPISLWNFLIFMNFLNFPELPNKIFTIMLALRIFRIFCGFLLRFCIFLLFIPISHILFIFLTIL